MATALISQFREIVPKHTAKLLAGAVQCSIRSAKRYLAEPELFPSTRAVDLLRAIEQEERRLDFRREQRQQRREAVAREIHARMGLDRAGGNLFGAGERLGSDLGTLYPSERAVPPPGHETGRVGRPLDSAGGSK